MSESEPIKRTTARLPKSLHKRIKDDAYRLEITLDQWIQEAAESRLLSTLAEGGSTNPALPAVAEKPSPASVQDAQTHESIDQLADAVVKVLQHRLSDSDLRHIAAAAARSGVAKGHGRLAKAGQKGKKPEEKHARTGT